MTTVFHGINNGDLVNTTIQTAARRGIPKAVDEVLRKMLMQQTCSQQIKALLSLKGRMS